MKKQYQWNKILIYSFLFLTSINTYYVRAQNTFPCVPVILDGFSHEWPKLSDTSKNSWVTSIIDPIDKLKNIDIAGLQITNDENNIYFHIVFHKPYPLGENNSLFLELDTDNNPLTGYHVNGIGAELGWQFGQRFGYFKHSLVADMIAHRNLGFMFAPPFTAIEYEVAISLSAEPKPGIKLFVSDTIHIALWDNSENGDLAPDYGQVFTYIIKRNCGNSAQLPEIKIKPDKGFRVLSWNVFNDGFTDPSRKNDFAKILQLLNPDIISFIECWQSQPEEVDSILQKLLPGTWYVRKYGEGVIFASRFKILDIIPVKPGANENIVGFKLRKDNTDFLFFSCHLSCCYFDAERILETQALMAIINKEATYQDGNLRMPVILAGDFNIVGSDVPYKNLTTGRLHLSQKPVLRDLVPVQTDRPSAITWRDYEKIFSPARLDYIFYSPSNLYPIHSFILNTRRLKPEILEKMGLDAEIMSRCSDHLPLVADFLFTALKNK